MTGRSQVPPGLWRDPGHFLAFGAGTGLMPWAPGTWGTLPGVAAWCVMEDWSPTVFWTIVALLFACGIPLCGRTARTLGIKDHGAIVWDEIVGVLVTLGLSAQGTLDVLVGFCAFRALDILKPWPIRVLDRRLEGGFGIMVDDLAAGLLAGLAIALTKYLS